MSSNPEIRPPQTWAGRNAGSIIAAVSFFLLGLVIFVQSAC